MSKIHFPTLRIQRSLLFRYLSILLLSGATLFSNKKALSQAPIGCGSVNCTSNDVRVISAYISGPNNSPIDCGALNPPGPFHNAELHLIVS